MSYILCIEQKKSLKSIQQYNEFKTMTVMNNVFMHSENSKISDPHRLLINLTKKYTLGKTINMLLYQISTFNIHGKILKSHIRITNLKYQLQHGMKNFKIA